jgi:hypothetical protein
MYSFGSNGITITLCFTCALAARNKRQKTRMKIIRFKLLFIFALMYSLRSAAFFTLGSKVTTNYTERKAYSCFTNLV